MFFGKHPLQLYSLGTPNGIKITVLLEELLALGHEGAEYDAFLINIGEGAQFGSGFVEINPNSIVAYNNLSILLQDSGKFKEAIIISKKIIDIRPWSITGCLSLNHDPE